MKTIQLNIEDGVYIDLNNFMMTKSMMGNAFGIEDSFVIKILKSIDEDKKEVLFKYKNENLDN